MLQRRRTKDTIDCNPSSPGPLARTLQMPRAEPVGAIPVGGYRDVPYSDGLTAPLTAEDRKRRASVQSNDDHYTLDRGMVFEGRACHDAFFAVLYLLVLVAAFGTASASLTNADYTLEPPAELGCPELDASRDTGALHALLRRATPGVQSFDSFLESFKRKVPWVLPAVVGGAVAIGFVYLQLLRCFARPMVYISLGFFPAGFTAAGVAIISLPEDAVGGWDKQGRLTTMYILFALAAVYLLVLCCLRKRIEMTIRTLTTAGEALANTAAVFLTCFGVFLVWLVLATATGTGMVVALFNGEWSAVEDAEGNVESCVYALDDTGSSTLAVCAFTFLWTSLLFTELRGFVVAGTIGHWYYHSTDASPPLKYPSLTACSLAFGKSFGSMCLGSLILAIIQVILFIIRAAREANRDSDNVGVKIVLCLLECCIQCIYEIVRIFTSFVTIVTSISGQSFVQSAKTVSAVCRRNGFEIVVVDSLASAVLSMGAFIFSLALATIPWIALVIIEPLDEEPLSDSYYAYTGGLCGAAFLVGMIVLGSFSGIVLNAASTLFICFVVDRDVQTHGTAYGNGEQQIVLATHVQVVHATFLETHPPKLDESQLIDSRQ